MDVVKFVAVWPPPLTALRTACVFVMRNAAFDPVVVFHPEDLVRFTQREYGYGAPVAAGSRWLLWGLEALTDGPPNTVTVRAPGGAMAVVFKHAPEDYVWGRSVDVE